MLRLANRLDTGVDADFVLTQNGSYPFANSVKKHQASPGTKKFSTVRVLRRILPIRFNCGQGKSTLIWHLQWWQ